MKKNLLLFAVLLLDLQPFPEVLKDLFEVGVRGKMTVVYDTIIWVENGGSSLRCCR